MMGYSSNVELVVNLTACVFIHRDCVQLDRKNVKSWRKKFAQVQRHARM